jgi:hypothetical protein
MRLVIESKENIATVVNNIVRDAVMCFIWPYSRMGDGTAMS